MSRFTGHQGKGALAAHRARKRQEAAQRAERGTLARNFQALSATARAAREQPQPSTTVVTAAGVFVDGKRTHR